MDSRYKELSSKVSQSRSVGQTGAGIQDSGEDICTMFYLRTTPGRKISIRHFFCWWPVPSHRWSSAAVHTGGLIRRVVVLRREKVDPQIGADQTQRDAAGNGMH